MPEAKELVGRQRERAALRDAIATATGGDGGLLLVAGEGGIGKTALVESALAEDGGLVLRGAADQRAVRPYAPIVAALRAYQRVVPMPAGFRVAVGASRADPPRARLTCTRHRSGDLVRGGRQRP